DLDRLTGLGVAPGAGGPLGRSEGAEPVQAHLVATLDLCHKGVEHSTHSRLSLPPLEPRRIGDCLDELGSVHRYLLSKGELGPSKGISPLRSSISLDFQGFFSQLDA